jgi:hypothetical protein
VSELLDLDEEMVLTLVEVHGQRWTRDQHLMGDLLQLVDRGNRLLEVVAGIKKGERSKPLKVPRPRGPGRPKRVANVSDLRALAQEYGGAMEGVSHA